MLEKGANAGSQVLKPDLWMQFDGKCSNYTKVGVGKGYKGTWEYVCWSVRGSVGWLVRL